MRPVHYWKKKRRDTWKAYHAPVGGKEGDNGDDEEEELATPTATEMIVDNGDDDYDNDILGLTCEIVVDNVEGEEDTAEELADACFEQWMNHTVTYSKYVFEGRPPIKTGGTTGTAVNFKEIVAKFDTMKFFREEGTEKWPTITILARIHFSKMDNAAFQERVFSTAANVMSKQQGRMAFDHLEKADSACAK